MGTLNREYKINLFYPSYNSATGHNYIYHWATQ